MTSEGSRYFIVDLNETFLLALQSSQVPLPKNKTKKLKHIKKRPAYREKKLFFFFLTKKYKQTQEKEFPKESPKRECVSPKNKFHAFHCLKIKRAS
jgi:hypothetical protein